MKLCAPAVVYLVLAIIALVLNMRFSMVSILLHVAFIGLWTFILNWICSKGFKWVSWVLVVLPYLFAALVWLIGVEIMAINKMNAHHGSRLSVNSYEGFADNDVTAFTPEQIQGLTQSDIQTLTPEQIKGLSITQLQSFTPIQLASFTPTQVLAFTPEQIAGFSNSNNQITDPVAN
uniref:Uncharacterized protein n=1 Tax=viral metagenome TaxID=1070528 RepID=A0A6C0HZZ0_9ZZZZ